MTPSDTRATHHDMLDAAGIGLGVLVALSPWLTGHSADSPVLRLTAAAGIIVLIISAVQLMIVNREQELLVLACGLWLIASPFVLGYAGTTLSLIHFVLGAAITALALLELRQDWNMTDVSIGLFGSRTTPHG